MSDTLANDWRQRMAGRSALCAVLLAVPVAVAAQISFSAGLDSVPFGVSTFAAGPDTSSIGPSGTVAPSQNLSTLLDGDGPAADAATDAIAGAPADGSTGAAATPSAINDVSDGGVIVPGPGGGGEDPGGSGGGGENPGGTGGDPNPTPPTPPTTPPATPEPPATTPAQPSVPGVTVPDVGGVIDSVTDPVGQATGLLPSGGG